MSTWLVIVLCVCASAFMVWMLDYGVPFLVMLAMDRTERKVFGGKSLEEFVNEKRKEATVLGDRK